MIDEKTVRAVIARLDNDVEPELLKLRQDVERHEDNIARLVEAMRERQDGYSQPDWLTVNKAAAAEAILFTTNEWLERCGVLLGLDIPPCWPWHPRGVALLLAGCQHHKAARTSATAMTDFLTVRIPAIKRELKLPCRDATHVDGHGMTYTIHRDQLPDLAAWWANDRTGRPPGLTPRIVAA